MGQAGDGQEGVAVDPVAIDWAHAELPHAWPDKLNFLRPGDVLSFIRHVAGARAAVDLPKGLPGREWLPSYLLQEFHRLPNGMYSQRVASGYANWFDRVMLGQMHAARRDVARALAGCDAVLDVGCGAGALAGALREQGVGDIWGVDACPYLLKCAARRNRNVRFVQGLAEATGFPDARFAGVGACFLFHELPPEVADGSLTEICRILRPGGLLAIAEPAPEHLLTRRIRGLLRLGGLRAIYFGLLARLVYEPAVAKWHARDMAQWFPRFGFRLERDESRIPFRLMFARKLR